MSRSVLSKGHRLLESVPKDSLNMGVMQRGTGKPPMGSSDKTFPETESHGHNNMPKMLGHQPAPGKKAVNSNVQGTFGHPLSGHGKKGNPPSGY